MVSMSAMWVAVGRRFRRSFVFGALSVVLLASPCGVWAELPGWYLNPPMADDAIYGVGASDGVGTESRATAIMRALDDISTQISSALAFNQASVVRTTFYQGPGLVLTSTLTQSDQHSSRSLIVHIQIPPDRLVAMFDIAAWSGSETHIESTTWYTAPATAGGQREASSDGDIDDALAQVFSPEEGAAAFEIEEIAINEETVYALVSHAWDWGAESYSSSDDHAFELFQQNPERAFEQFQQNLERLQVPEDE